MVAPGTAGKEVAEPIWSWFALTVAVMLTAKSRSMMLSKPSRRNYMPREESAEN